MPQIFFGPASPNGPNPGDIWINPGAAEVNQVQWWNGGYWEPVAEGGAGLHTHPQADVTSLVADLAAKASSGHTHAYAPESHTHVDADLPAGIARDVEVTTAVSDHAAAADPHTVYQKESEKNGANGYAGLSASSLLALAQLGTGTPDTTTYLRGDSSWVAPPFVPLAGGVMTGNLDAAIRDKGGAVYNAKAYGVVGDCRSVADGAMTKDTAILTSATAAWVAGDVGKPIIVKHGLISGADLVTTILSRQSATQVTLNANATIGVAGATVAWGTDDGPALNTLLATTIPTTGVLFIPEGQYLLNTAVVSNRGVSIRGAGPGRTILVGGFSIPTANVLSFNAAGTAAQKNYSVHVRDFSILMYNDRAASSAAMLVGNVGASAFSDISISHALGGRPYVGVWITRASQTVFSNVRVGGCSNNGWNITNDDGYTIVDMWLLDGCTSDLNWGNGVSLNNSFSSAGSSTEGIYIGHMSMYANGSPGVANSSALRISAAASATINNVMVQNAMLDTTYNHGLLTEGAGTIRRLRLNQCWVSFNGNPGHGLITSVTVTAGGSGYTTPPAVSFSGGGGSGATAYAVINASGAVTSVVMTDYGTSYSSVPTVSFSGGGGTGATGTAVKSAGNGHGVYLDTLVTEFDMDASWIILSGAFGLYCKANRGRITNNLIANNSQTTSAQDYGVLLDAGSAYLTVAGNHLYNAPTTSAFQDGLSVIGGGGGVSNTLIANNWLDVNAGSGTSGLTPLTLGAALVNVRLDGNVTDAGDGVAHRTQGGTLAVTGAGTHVLGPNAAEAGSTAGVLAVSGQDSGAVRLDLKQGGTTRASLGYDGSNPVLKNDRGAGADWFLDLNGGGNWYFWNSGVKMGVSSTGVLINEAEHTLKQVSTPSAPAAGYTSVYVKSGGGLYTRANGGAEIQVESRDRAGAVSGYATLDANTRVPDAQLGTGTPTAAVFLRGDRSWAAPVDEVVRSLEPTAWHGAANLTTVTALVTNVSYFLYVGRIGKILTTADVICNVTTGAATITWAEVGVFKGVPVANGAATGLTRLGFTNVAATFNGTGIKKTTVALTGHAAEDDVWIAFGSQATTPYQIRAGLADDIQSGGFQSFAGRISTMGASTGTLVAATLAVPMTRLHFV